MKAELKYEFPVGPDLTLDQLANLRERGNVPGHAKVSIRVSKGDRSWESDTFYIKFSWTDES